MKFAKVPKTGNPNLLTPTHTRRTFVRILATAAIWAGIPVSGTAVFPEKKDASLAKGTGPSEGKLPEFEDTDFWADPGWR